MEYLGLTLDKFQEDAINAIEQGKSVVVSAPTGSGKTLIANYLIDLKIKQKQQVIYTAPIKALSNQKYKEFINLYGETNVGLMTGDIVENPDAPIVIMTTEIYRNMAIAKDERIEKIFAVVFDEVHYINDIERGHIWEESVIFSPEKVRFLCLSATIPNAKEFSDWIEKIKGHEVTTITHHKRIVPLTHKFYDIELGIADLQEIHDVANIPNYHHAVRGKRNKRQRPQFPDHTKLIKELGNELPALFFCFSRDRCEKKAKELAETGMFTSSIEISNFVRKKLQEAPDEICRLKTTKILRETLSRHIGFHHAGLLPVLKEIVEELFARGLIKVLYATETFAVGINMPARTVCFDSLKKYDGISLRYLNTKEYFQMAGRAGRRGIDTHGLVITQIVRNEFDYEKIKKVTSKDIEPIKSQFKLTINTVLNMLKLHSQEEIEIILKQSFLAYQMEIKKRKLDMKTRFENKIKQLEKLNYVQNRQLTEKGIFASKIYSDEILTTEIFATDRTNDLDEHAILIILAVLSYEPREKDRFFKPRKNAKTREVRHLVDDIPLTRKDNRFRYVYEATSLIEPCQNDGSFFDILDITSISEGNLIRFYNQITDRIQQIQRASMNPHLSQKLTHIRDRIRVFLEDVNRI
jgi:superfamily II RNA helicase